MIDRLQKWWRRGGASDLAVRVTWLAVTTALVWLALMAASTLELSFPPIY